jgi:hypothetical protein
VKSPVIKSVLVLCVLLVVACAEPDPVSGPSSTIDQRVGTTEVAPATTSTLAETTTTSTTPTTSSSTVPATSSPTAITPIAGDPPEITLKPPGLYEIIPANDVSDYFFFQTDVAQSHTTKLRSWDEDETFSVTARTSGEFSHLVMSGVEDGELMVRGDGAEVWVRDDSGAWTLDEEMLELPFYVFYASPDVAYSTAFNTFDSLKFTSWVEVDGQRLAVYRGGAAEAAKALREDPVDSEGDARDGAIEVWWSDDGYFPMVSVELSDAYGPFEMDWTITDVGTTEVEPPA